MSSRSEEFDASASAHRPVYHEPLSVRIRYGDKKQIPAPVERKGGPLPYPETYEEFARMQDEINWSRRQ